MSETPDEVDGTTAVDDEVMHLHDDCQIPNPTLFHLYHHPYLVKSFYSLTMPCMHKLHRGSNDLFQQTGSQRMQQPETGGASGPIESYFGTNVSFMALDGTKSSKSLSVAADHATMKKRTRGIAVPRQARRSSAEAGRCHPRRQNK
jgi:hypothetical protein